ncbi:MAG: hypothetical protein OHK0056_08560 [Bacteriovoracaceae bacterium]
MMKKIVFVILLSIFGSSIAFADSVEQKRDRLLEIVDEELRETTRLNKQVGSRNPTLLLRVAELYLEKARLIRERENKEYLVLSPEKRNQVDKKRFFRGSEEYFIKAQKTCYFILKRFPKFNNKADVYYILAYNAKEFQRNKEALGFFQKAVRSSGKNPETTLKSKLALAEMYFNQKEFAKAIPLYEETLRNKKQRWWTKDAYNLAWSYFRVGKKTQALNLMNEVHKLSANNYYVDMRNEVERDLSFFYADVGQAEKAIAFYKSIGKDITGKLISVAKYLKDQGKFTQAEKALITAQKYAETEESKIAIHVELLSLYEKYGKLKEHYESSAFIVEGYKNGKLSADQLDMVKYHVNRMSALLLKQVANKAYASQLRMRREKASYAARYFELAAELEPNKAEDAYYYAAEAYYADEKFDNSLKYYNQAFELAEKNNNQKIRKLALEGMMASLGKEGVSKQAEEEYLVKAYEEYLKSGANKAQANKILQRLFSVSMQKGDVAKAEKALIAYKNYYPDQIGTQEAMLGKIMDHYKAKGDRQSMMNWAQKVNDGEFKVSPKYAERLKVTVLAMQFEGVEKATRSGDKKQALAGYLRIYKSPEATSDAKMNAAYNMAVLFSELDNAQYTYRWLKQALEMMQPSDVQNFDSSMLLMATKIHERRLHSQAAELNTLLFNKLCSTKSKNKPAFYKNATLLWLADKKYENAIKVSDAADFCKISESVQEDVKEKIIEVLADDRQFSALQNYIYAHANDKRLIPSLVYPSFQLSDALLDAGRRSDAEEWVNRAMKFYQQAIAQKSKVQLEALDRVALIKMKRLEGLVNQNANIQLSFPEDRYNTLLKQKFALLDQITNEALAIFNIGSGKGVVKAYTLMTKSYDQTAQEILNFKPEGKSPEYVDSFFKSMQSIALPLRNKAAEFKREAISQIVKNDILSEDNSIYTLNSKYPVPIFRPLRPGVLMDRGGGQ